MTKRILLATVVVAFTFLGCTGKDAQPTAEATKKVEKADTKLKEATKKVEDAAKNTIANDTKKSGIVDPNKTVEPALPESSLKDKAVEKAVEVADEKTDGTATQVIESVQ